MGKHVLALLAATLVVAGCSSADDGSVEDSSVTVTVGEADVEAELSDDLNPIEMTGGSSLAFVDTPSDGDLVSTIEPSAPEPTSVEVMADPPSTRFGIVGTDGVATVAYVLWTWDGEQVLRSSETADRLSVKIGNPSDAPPDAVVFPTAFEDVLAAKPIGSRLTALFPAGTIGMPRAAETNQAHVLVLDILAFQTPEDS